MEHISVLLMRRILQIEIPTTPATSYHLLCGGKRRSSLACINASLLRACSGEVPSEGWETRQKPHRVLQFGPSRKWNAWETAVRAHNSNQPGKGGSREAMQEEETVAAFAFECLPSPFHSEPVTSAFTRVSDILC